MNDEERELIDEERELAEEERELVEEEREDRCEFGGICIRQAVEEWGHLGHVGWEIFFIIERAQVGGEVYM